MRTNTYKITGKFIILLSLFLCLISKTYGLEFNLKLGGGISFINPANINLSLQGWEEYSKRASDANANWHFMAGDIKSLNNAIEFEGELVFNFNPRIALSIGTGFIFSELNPKNPNFSIEKKVNTYEYIHTIKANTLPVILSGYYFFPLSDKFKVYAKGGAGLIWAQYIDREGKKRTDNDNYGYDSAINAKARGTMLSGALGLTVETEEGVNFFIESCFRKSNVNDFTGESQSGENGTLYFLDEFDPDLEFWQSKFQVLKQEPLGDNFRSVTRAKINLSGFSVKLGIIINF